MVIVSPQNVIIHGVTAKVLAELHCAIGNKYGSNASLC